MKKYTSLILIFVISLTLFYPVSNNRVYGMSINDETKERIITIAKGAVALYLLNTLTNMVKESDESETKMGNIVVDEVPINNTKFDLSGKVIVIDPGHGGSDPGAIGPGGLKEKDVNLDIARRLYKILKNNTNARVHLTRDLDKFISLDKRSDLAKSLNADMFISIHSNADEQGKQSGIETYAYYSTSGDTWALAWYIHESLVKGLKLKDRGLKADNFHVIRETANINSILLEIGFISNKKEEALLKDDRTRENAARTIYQGIVNYLEK